MIYFTHAFGPLRGEYCMFDDECAPSYIYHSKRCDEYYWKKTKNRYLFLGLIDASIFAYLLTSTLRKF